MTMTQCLETQSNLSTALPRDNSPAQLVAGGEVCEFTVQVVWTDAVASDDCAFTALHYFNRQRARGAEAESEPCVALFERWAASEPERLLAFLRDSNASSVRLAEAAEAAGEVADPEACEVLLSLLNHQSHFVREAATYALEDHVGREHVRARLERLREVEQSRAVRSALDDVLDQ